MVWTFGMISLCTFLSVSALAALALVRVFGRDPEMLQRIAELKGPRDPVLRGRFYRSRRNAQQTLSASLARFGSKLLPGSVSGRSLLVERFLHAGIYSPLSPSIYSSLRM